MPPPLRRSPHLWSHLTLPSEKVSRPIHGAEPLRAAGAVCPWNSTLRTLQLKQGYWRLSDTSMSILKCDVDVDDDDDKLDERCEGGGMVYTCAPGHEGPLCQVWVASL